jgi:hypothetical protein
MGQLKDIAMKRNLTALTLILGTLFAGYALGQDEPLKIGGFENQGSATLGFRFQDVSGYQPKFQELFNLRGGLRLTDFDLMGDDPTHTNRFMDHYSLTATGIGGDPFMTTQLGIRKAKLYDLRINWRQSQYYWNRNDSAFLPNGVNSLTNYHDWATVRKMGNVNLLVHASNNLRFTFELYRNTRDGVNMTTRSLDYFGSSSTWGGFARANPYVVVAPLAEEANRATGGVDYTKGGWAFHYKLGYQSFKSAIDGRNLLSPERSINIDDVNTAKELVTSISWVDSRKLHTPVSEFSYTGNITSKLKARGGYLFYRYEGPASLDYAFTGVGRTTSATVTAPYSNSMSSQANVREPNNVVDQGFTYQVKPWWSILLDYRYNRFTVDALSNSRSVTGTIVATGGTETNWKLGTHTLDYNMTFTPISSLLVRAGVRLMKSDVAYLEDGVTDRNRTKRINTVAPIGSVYWQPSKIVSVRADVDATTNGASYTRVTPHTDRGARFVVRIRPTEKFYIEEASVIRNRRLIDTDYTSTIRTAAFTGNYEFSPKLSAFAGFSYDSFFASNFVNFLRGTAPFTNLYLRDQTVSRVWQGGFRTGSWKGVGVQFTGNFVRTTGSGQIAGELPLYGPVTFPYATGSIYYDMKHAGRFTLQLQRTYYSEQIVTGNNFGAKLLTVAWTRSLTQR